MGHRNVNQRMAASVIALGLWLFTSQAGTAPTSNDRLAAIKALYAAADYEAALIVLSTEGVGSLTDQYRALCLLALGRLDEVDRLLESLVARDPAFRMSAADVTPRLIALFQETRRRLLPGILDDRFSAAKASFERGSYADAASTFKDLLALIADEQAAPGEGAIVTRDMQRVAEGFLNLSEKALAEGSKAIPRDTNEAPKHSRAASRPSDDETVIKGVVEKYAQAYSSLDAEAVTRVFQGENPRPLQAMFDALKSQAVDARDVRIALDPGGWSATVTLTWVVHAVPKAGSPKKTQMVATLRMLKVVTGEWFIVSRR